MMNQLNLSLPEALSGFVDQQVELCGYATRSEYVRALIRKEQDRQHLQEVLLSGAHSDPAEPADSRYFAALRARVQHV